MVGLNPCEVKLVNHNQLFFCNEVRQNKKNNICHSVLEIVKVQFCETFVSVTNIQVDAYLFMYGYSGHGVQNLFLTRSRGQKCLKAIGSEQWFSKCSPEIPEGP